jgi:hypothetical protein
MFSVYQHWDPLEYCVVGRAYPPNFFHWITNQKTRRKFEKLARETEEDYQKLIDLLTKKFSVEVVRPYLPENLNDVFVANKWVPPPTAPRDYFIMIHDQLWVPRVPNGSHAWHLFYRQNKQHHWPDYVRPCDFYAAHPDSAQSIKDKFEQFRTVDQKRLDTKLTFYKHIFDQIAQQGNDIVFTDLDFVNGCFVSRIGQDLYFATQTFHDNKPALQHTVDQNFKRTRNRIVDAGGHGDAVYCPICPGLIISLNDVPTYADTFPGWEVVFLPPSNYKDMREFEFSMKQNKGKWFVPGFEHDTYLQHLVDFYFDDWVGQVSETVFDVNILIVDHRNIVVSAHNDSVEKACQRHNIEVHVVPFRHKYFWDCGIHCITNDLSRRGRLQNFFLDRVDD